MAEKKIDLTKTKTGSKDLSTGKTSRLPLFEKENYMWMGIGAAIIAIGMFIMSGGKNPDPNQFDTKLVYSTTRITIAPILIIAGLVIEIFAIMKKQKEN